MVDYSKILTLLNSNINLEQIKIDTELLEDIYNRLSIKNKILLILFDKKHSIKELNEYEITTFNTLKKSTSELNTENYIDSNKEGKYNINVNGIKKLKTEIIKLKTKSNDISLFINDILEYNKDDKKVEVDLEKEENFVSLLKKINKIKNKITIDNIIEIDYIKLNNILNEEEKNYFKNNFNILYDHLKYTFSAMFEKEQVIIRFSNWNNDNIETITNNSYKKTGLIFVKGMIVKKSSKKILWKKRSNYLCSNPECDFFHKKIIITNRGLNKKKLKSCPSCKSLVNYIDCIQEEIVFLRIRDEKSNYSLELLLQGDLVKKSVNFQYGDRITATGNFEEFDIDKENTEIVLITNNIQKKDFKVKLNKEEIKQIENNLNKIDENYLLKPFSDFESEKWIKELFLIQQLSQNNPEFEIIPLHITWMGDPGVGKDKIRKLLIRYFPNVHFISGKNLTEAGLKGTVNQESGIKEIGLGVLAEDGTLFINEYDKAVERINKKQGANMFNELFSEQEIKLKKSGIDLHFNNINVRGILAFNPSENLKENIEFNEDIPIYRELKNVVDYSLLSRTLYIYTQSDVEITKKVINKTLLKLSQKDFKNNLIEDELDIEEYQKIILYLRNLRPILNEKGINKINDFLEILKKQDPNISQHLTRISQIIIQLILCKAKMKLEQNISLKTIDEAIQIYLNSLETIGINIKNMSQLYLNTSIQEETILGIIEEWLLKKENYNKKFYFSEIKSELKINDDKLMKKVLILLENQEKIIALGNNYFKNNFQFNNLNKYNSLQNIKNNL